MFDDVMKASFVTSYRAFEPIHIDGSSMIAYPVVVVARLIGSSMIGATVQLYFE